MNFAELVLKTRTHRRFRQDRPVDMQTLEGLVDLARNTASAANLQPLRYVLSCSPETNAAIFATLGWAAYLPHWQGPEEGERPAAYIVVLAETAIGDHKEVDMGIAAQTMVLGAAEKGLASCMLASVNRDKLRDILSVPEEYAILLVIALGEPAEAVVLEDLPTDGSIKYWRDDQDVHHVPKRTLGQVVLAKHS
jgi:nitroreductase